MASSGWSLQVIISIVHAHTQFLHVLLLTKGEVCLLNNLEERREREGGIKRAKEERRERDKERDKESERKRRERLRTKIDAKHQLLPGPSQSRVYPTCPTVHKTVHKL